MIANDTIGLRAWEPHDIPHYQQWCSQPDIRTLFDASVEQRPLPYYQRRYEQQLLDPHTRSYAIILLPDELIGRARWTRVRDFGVFDVGLVIGSRELWGRGYGQMALGLLLGILFDSLCAHKVQATTFEFNERSQCLFTRAGFTVEGRIRDDVFINGRFFETIRMGLLRSEHLAAQPEESR